MCGLTGIVSIRHKQDSGAAADMAVLREMLNAVEARQFDRIDELLQQVRVFKRDEAFFQFFINKSLQDDLARLTNRLSVLIEKESKSLSEQMGRLNAREVEVLSFHIEQLKDLAWCVNTEILDNIAKVRDLLYRTKASPEVVGIFRRINAVLNSIDRLEVRGRDSAGISLIFVLDKTEFENFRETLDKANFMEQWKERSERDVLLNMGIGVHETSPQERSVAVSFTYKVAAEIGSLGDNIRFLRRQIRNDVILQAIVNFTHRNHTVLCHTRWASVGAISEANCHPVDNDGRSSDSIGMVHVCLNGDIDNYLELKAQYEHSGKSIHKEVTTDTKIIPLQIEKYVRGGDDILEAFRKSLNDFDGSHAIAMHSDLAPGKLFLAQRGSGQAIFVGLAKDHYMAASEVYGFIEETSQYLKLDGEKTIEGANGRTQGQIFVLDQESSGGLSGIRAMYYDGTAIQLSEADIKHTEITSRDIDRQSYPHYFLKEISEAPVSVEKTMLNRWKITDEKPPRYVVSLDDKVVPESVRVAFADNKIRRVFFVGQGTAGIAAQACADILSHYLNDPDVTVCSMKASELSGFKLHENGGMSDTLVVAITQSGTTTDTNRAVDMVKERGAYTLAIVNRRDSHITFKVHGVMYTSSGRDIEMSVASTKAFYSQIVAGAMLSLFLAKLKNRRDDEFVEKEIRQLLELPGYMRKILSMREAIETSAKRIAITRTYWAVVGSGPNKTSSDEIRIKLSELCYKTISSDYVEDKKHIDLSSEPLILVCAGGSRPAVLNDIIKDVAIFRAHKALPVIIADDGERRFDPYSEDVFHVPPVSEHLAPIVNTLVGHIWGYYAALAINEGSRFLYQFREDMQKALDDYAKQGMNVYEVILEKSFREKIAAFYYDFRRKTAEKKLPVTMNITASSDLILLLKYLSGRLPMSDFELDFGIRGTAKNMLDTLFECLGKSVNDMARPVDAIKHQAKTVTVGTSRISEKVDGILFDVLRANGFKVSQMTASNIIVLRNLQEIIAGILGTTIYRIDGLNLLGEPTDNSTIEVIRREGSSAEISSRVERDNRLKGSKRIIVRQGNVYIGKGRRDDRSIVCIPLISASAEIANTIEHLVLLHVAFKDFVPLQAKIKALGGKYEHIKNIVHENSISWDDKNLELIEISELFGISAEKVGEFIVARLK